MTHDERDRREGTDEGDTPTDPEPRADSPAGDETAAWPSGDERTGTDAPSTSGGSADAPREAWPTEPPTADDSRTDAWPTNAPERGEPPVLEPRDDDAEQPAAASADADEWRPAEPWKDEPAEPEPEPVTADAGPRADSTSEPAAHEAPPSEVEAYPAAPTAAEAAEPDATAAAAAHSVPAAESATGESTQCPRCGTENRPGLAFCRNCGQRLVAAGTAATLERPGTPEGTQACPRCGTHNRAGVGFCQNCGANLRGTAPGYVPPAVASDEEAASAPVAAGHAILGPVVLLIGLVGLVTAYLLPFAYGSDSLFDRAWGSGGYGVAFWNGYPDVFASLVDQAYFGLAGPSPLLALLVLGLAIAGFARAAPGPLQVAGLLVTLLWSIGLVVLFFVVELAANWDGDVVGLLRDLTPAGIIFLLTSLILLIGSLTRFARS